MFEHLYYMCNKHPVETSISENTITYKYRIYEPEPGYIPEDLLPSIPTWKQDAWFFKVWYSYNFPEEDGEEQLIEKEISGYFEEN